MAAHISPQSKCATCFRFIPSWDLHLKMSKNTYISTDLMSNVANSASAENVSASSIYSTSPETRRRAEALKYAKESTNGVDSRSMLSPYPNSAGGVGVTGDNVVVTIPTQAIPGEFANKISLAISPGSGQALGRKPASAGVLPVVTISPRANTAYPGRNDVSSRPTDPRSYPGSGVSQPLDDVARNQGPTCPDGGLGEHPSSSHGHEGPSASSPVEVSVPLAGGGNSMHGSSGQPCPGQPRQPRSLARGIPTGGFPRQ